MLIMENAVADEGCSNQPGCSQNVRDGVNVLTSGDRESLLQDVCEFPGG